MLTVHNGYRGLEYSASQILGGWQRKINWVLFYALSSFYHCPFSCPQVYLPRSLYLTCPSSISSSGWFQYYCHCAASPVHLFGLVLLTSKFLHIQFQSLLYLNQMRNLSLSSNWSLQEVDATEKKRWDRLSSISLSSQTDPAWLVPGSPCTVVKALLALGWAWQGQTKCSGEFAATV